MKRIQPIWKEVTTRVLDHAAIGANARSLRRENGLTLQQVAEVARMSISQLSHLENGERSWSTRDMDRITSAIDLASLRKT